MQVSREKEGKLVDGKCHALTASYIRERHEADSSVNICKLYTVCHPGFYNEY